MTKNIALFIRVYKGPGLHHKSHTTSKNTPHTKNTKDNNQPQNNTIRESKPQTINTDPTPDRAKSGLSKNQIDAPRIIYHSLRVDIITISVKRNSL